MDKLQENDFANELGSYLDDQIDLDYEAFDSDDEGSEFELHDVTFNDKFNNDDFIKHFEDDLEFLKEERRVHVKDFKVKYFYGGPDEENQNEHTVEIEFDFYVKLVDGKLSIVSDKVD